MNSSLKLPLFSDGSVAFFKLTTVLPQQELAKGLRVSAMPGLLGRALLMWRKEDHYLKRMPGQDPEDLGAFYIISWLTYGPGYKDRETALQALDYYEAKGWSLVESEGPPASPKCVPVERFDDVTEKWVSEPRAVGHRMKPLPKDWQKVNDRVISEMSKKPTDVQIDTFNKLAKENLAEVVRALKAGTL